MRILNLKRWVLPLAVVIAGSPLVLPLNKAEAKAKETRAANSAGGFKFPAQVASFRRSGPVKSDAAGDPYASYWAGHLILADVFYYRTSGHALQREYSDCRDYVRIYTPSARLISDAVITISPRGESYRGHRAIFTAKKGRLGPGGPAKSQLLIFQLGDRFVKYRISYPLAHAERAEQEIDLFLKALAWPGT
jgi:hypothetical protein